MKIQTIPIGVYQTNAYLVLDEESGARMAVDPGDGGGALLEYLIESDLRIDQIAVTHGHMDHYADAAQLAEYFETPIYFPEQETAYLTSPEAQRGPYDAQTVRQFENALAQRGVLMNEGGRIRLGSLGFEVASAEWICAGGLAAIWSGLCVKSC